MLLNRPLEVLVDLGVTKNFILEEYIKRFNVSLIRKTELYLLGTIKNINIVKVE